ncbi:MAG TPA: hypothetical protein VGH38_29970 [Bryobacteraceae bacterium]
MRRVLLLVLWAGGLSADVVTMNDGRQVSGVVESGNTQELHIKVGDQAQTQDIHQVQAIQFGVSTAAAPASTKAIPLENRTLILKDGTRVAGKWWSIDAGQVHFLVNNQLQHYSRSDVSALTSGDAVLPAPSAPSSPPAAPPAQSPAAAPQPQPPTLQRSPASPEPATPPAQSPAAAPKPQSPTLQRSPASPPPAAPPAQSPAATTKSQPPTLQRSPASPPPAAPSGVSQPDEIGAVYFFNGRNLTPLERNQAVERKRGSAPYWEIPGAQSQVRVEEASALAFIVRLPKGVNPASYSLFPLTTGNGNRQTSAQTGRKGGLMTWPFEIQTNNESSYMTYAFIVKDLPTGEYSFSPSSSNDSYCFGVDSAK